MEQQRVTPSIVAKESAAMIPRSVSHWLAVPSSILSNAILGSSVPTSSVLFDFPLSFSFFVFLTVTTSFAITLATTRSV